MSLSTTNDFEAALAEALAGDEPSYEVSPVAPLDPDQVTQWVARVENVRKRKADVKAAYEAAAARIKAAHDAEIARLTQQDEWLCEALEMYHRVRLAEDEEGNKTIPLPTGVLKAGKWGGDTWTFSEDEFVAWALVHLPGAVEPQPFKLKKTDAKKLLKEAFDTDEDGNISTDEGGHPILADGTVVPALTITPAQTKFKIVTNFEVDSKAKDEEA